MSDRLRHAVAIVGGAGCRAGLGNGMASALRLAREGARLLLLDRDAAALRATCDAVAAEGGEFDALECDVSEAGAAEAMAARCLDRYGRIDVLVNNVGISPPGGLLSLSLSNWERTFAVNVRSVLVCSRAVVPAMRRQGRGSIVNVSSIAGRRVSLPPPHAYAASKAAVDMLTRTIAAEFAAEGIRCNSVVPGLIDTPMVGHSLQAAGLTEAEVRAYGEARHRLSPTGRQGSPWDVAAAVLYLASEDSAYVNGTELVVDGGLGNLQPTLPR